MTTADVSLVAKESIVMEKLKKNMQTHFFLSHTVYMMHDIHNSTVEMIS